MAFLTYRERTLKAGRHPGKYWHVGNVALSRREAALLFAVMCHPTIKTTELIEVIWPDPDFEPDYAQTGVTVLADALRKKLEPHGWTVRSTPGRRIDAPGGGYRLIRLPEIETSSEPLKEAA